MIQNEQTPNIRRVSPFIYKRRFGPKGVRTYVKRGLVLGLYLPLLIVVRWLLTAARIHGQARSISVARRAITLPNLPDAFDGLTIAFLTDFHCSALTPPVFLERVIDETNRFKPDVILLGGDYISEGAAFIAPMETMLARLDAPFGVYGVLGNHDVDADAHAVRNALKRAGVVELTNTGIWLTRAESRIRIAGVGDLWEDEQDLVTALGDAQANDTVILLSHNPDYAMQLTDPRVCLVLAGHTHGGQISLPYLGPLITNSKYRSQPASGLLSFNSFQLYVSRGLGTVMVPFRYNCPPEITLLTIRRSDASDDQESNPVPIPSARASVPHDARCNETNRMYVNLRICFLIPVAARFARFFEWDNGGSGN